MALIKRRLSEFVTQAEPFVPLLNCFSLFNIMTGSYVAGKHGERVLNGGVAPFMGFVAKGNMFKSTVMNDLFLSAFDKLFEASELSQYDTENLANRSRFVGLSQKFPVLRNQDFYDPAVLSVTKAENMIGNKWFEAFKKMMVEKEKDKKALLTTPFIDPRTGDLFRFYHPTMTLFDSISGFTTDAVDDIMAKGETGDKERNTVFMRDGLAKTQLMMELKDTLSRSGQYLGTVAHVGSKVNIDGKPEMKELTYMRQGEEMKGVPNKFDFYTGVCYEIFASSPLMAADKNGPQYPRSKEDDLKGDTDLMEIWVRALRNKYGQSGIAFPVIVSQTEGVQFSLSEYHYCKLNDYFGIGGDKTRFHMSLYPELTLMRTTIRKHIDEDQRLRRALEITGEMCMMFNIWHTKEIDELKCTPKELYEDIKALGYDWNEILDTRGYWVFEEQEEKTPYLSTMDLLRMRKGLYTPYWKK